MTYGYIKFRFYRGKEVTAGLVLPIEKFQRMAITELSELFPAWEAPKMHYIERSPILPNPTEAFLYDFDASPDNSIRSIAS